MVYFVQPIKPHNVHQWVSPEPGKWINKQINKKDTFFETAYLDGKSLKHVAESRRFLQSIQFEKCTCTWQEATFLFTSMNLKSTIKYNACANLFLFIFSFLYFDSFFFGFVLIQFFFLPFYSYFFFIFILVSVLFYAGVFQLLTGGEVLLCCIFSCFCLLSSVVCCTMFRLMDEGMDRWMDGSCDNVHSSD